MIFEQYYLDCLSQASYLIGDETTGRAVVVDPRRDIDEYVSAARDAGLTIELVIETHFHADFLSGHLELAEATGAEIAYGAAADTEFPSRKLAHGERLSLGDVTLEVRATPGHTPESISIVVYEHADDDVPYGVLSGDALFIGDVGRPDLLSSVGVTASDLAGRLYDSLHTQLLTLPDGTRLFPAHGAGSACGRNLSTETQSTIGEQRAGNYAVQPMTKDAFVHAVTEGQPVAPGYFSFDAQLNREDHALLDDSPPAALDWEGVRRLRADGAVLLDAREPLAFAAGHVRGAINVGLGGRFAEYVGSVVTNDQTVVLVTEEGAEHEAKVRMARIGFDRVAGYLADPVRVMVEHPDEVVRSSRLGIDELEQRLGDLSLGIQVVDVRNPGEFEGGALPNAVNLPLASLRGRLGELAKDRPVIVNCSHGFRSMVAASLLESNGFADVSDLLGGYAAWSPGESDN